MLAIQTKYFVILQPCNIPPTVCRCNVSHVPVDVKPTTTNHEVLVGVVGAMSSLLVSGTGFVLYTMFQGRCNSPLRSDESPFIKKKGNRNYGNVSSSERPTNVYRSGMGDNVNHKAANRFGSANSYNRGALSDWS